MRRADRGQPRKVPLAELERWCEIIAALKLRTTNKKGRHLSTARALALIEEHGIETPDGLVRLTFQEVAFPNAVRAKLAIADLLGRPLARLSAEERDWINGLLGEDPGQGRGAGARARALYGATCGRRQRRDRRGRHPMLTGMGPPTGV